MTGATHDLLAGQPLRNPDREACLVASLEAIRSGRLCALGVRGREPSFVLWGDSHGETLRGALHAAAMASGRAGLFAGERACPPLIGVTRQERPECETITETHFRAITEDPRITTVVLVARWGWWAEGLRYKRESLAPITLVPSDAAPTSHSDNRSALALGLERTISALLAAGKQVWLVGPVPEVGFDVPRFFYLRSIGFAQELEIAPTLAEFDSRQAFVLALFQDLARRHPIGTIWPHEMLCHDAGCDVVRDNHLLYADDDHLSTFAAQRLADLFSPVFD